MKIQLVVAANSPLCERAEKIWREVAAEHNFEFSVVDIERKEGHALAQRLDLKTIPALVVDGLLVAIGVQTLDQARQIVAASRREV
jgi:thioredoxin-like negative regulator of GroEL